MKKQIHDEKRIQQLVNEGSRFIPVPAHIENRILSGFREAEMAERQKMPGFTFRLFSAFSFGMLALVVVSFLGIFLWNTVFSSQAGSGLAVVSRADASLRSSGENLSPGYVLDNGDVIVCGNDAYLSATRKDMLDLHLFEQSELEILRYSRKNGEMSMVLLDGALYAHKKDKNPAVRVDIALSDYVFSMTGTRVYLSREESGLINALCFDGTVTVSRNTEELFVFSGDKAVQIYPDGSREFFDISELNAHAHFLDELLKNGLPAGEEVDRLAIHYMKRITRKEPLRESGEARIASDTQIPEFASEPYKVSLVGSISPANGESSFYSSVAAGRTAVFTNNTQYFRVSGNTIQELGRLEHGSAFKAKPVASGDDVFLYAADKLIHMSLSEPKNRMVLSLPGDGGIDHNYQPVIHKGILYIPVQNMGYYSVDISEAASDLLMLVREPFPVSPVFMDSLMIAGSYYNNYITATSNGREMFTHALDGSSYLNFRADLESVYYYVEKEDGIFIRTINTRGEELKAWKLEKQMKSDFVLGDSWLAGMYIDGNLFVLNTLSGENRIVARLFRNELSSRQLRNLNIRVYENLLYCPTDNGSLFVVDPATFSVKQKIAVDPAEIFHEAPLVLNGDIFAVSTIGNIYRIVTNE